MQTLDLLRLQEDFQTLAVILTKCLRHFQARELRVLQTGAEEQEEGQPVAQ